MLDRRRRLWQDRCGKTLRGALERFAPAVFASSEALGNFFGFQDDNVRNQAEHCLMLLANLLAQQPPGGDAAATAAACDVRALKTLHGKLFANYRQWCAALETQPQFAPSAPEGDLCGGAATDLVLWLCVWGEAGNLRHMPECCCFLYHSAAAEWRSTPDGEKQGDRGASLYPGHWLDSVVAPVYDVVSASMLRKSDHVSKRNYDDFNEFFWSKACLRYHRSTVATATALKHHDRRTAKATGDVANAAQSRGAPERSGLVDARRGVRSYDAAAPPFPPPVAAALRRAPKTYLEVRTWLHVVYAFQRVYEYRDRAGLFNFTSK